VQGYAKGQQGLAGISFERLGQRRSSNRTLLFDLGIFRRLGEPPAQIHADDPDGDAEQKG